MQALSDNSTLELNVDVFSFVVSQGLVADADLLTEQLRGCGVPHSEFERLRVAVSQVAGPRKAVVHVTGGHQSLTLRPAPAASSEITVFAGPLRDQRTQPQRRGPDLGWQQHAVATLGTSDGLLADARGRIISAVLQPLVTFPSATQAVVSGHPATTPSYALQGVVRVLEEAGVERWLLALRTHASGNVGYRPGAWRAARGAVERVWYPETWPQNRRARRVADAPRGQCDSSAASLTALADYFPSWRGAFVSA